MIGRAIGHVGGALIPVGMALAAVYVVKPTVAAVGLILIAYGYGVITGHRAGVVIQAAIDETRPCPCELADDDETREFTLERWEDR